MPSTLRTPVGLIRGEVHHLPSDTFCVPAQSSPLLTRWGRLVPRFTEEQPRYPDVPPVRTFDDGAVRELVLEQQISLRTSVGKLPAERLTFYRDGTLRRVFPVAGKTGPYWSEEDEAALCPTVTLETPVGPVAGRFISVCFFPTGALRSLTLWPGETAPVPTPLGVVQSRIGISFHPTGRLRAVEPAQATRLPTRVGTLSAFDGGALGVHGDTSSLEFTDAGELCALTTEDDAIIVADPEGVERRLAPRLVASACGDESSAWEPLRLRFEASAVWIGQERFSERLHSFRTEPRLGRVAVRLPVLCR